MSTSRFSFAGSCVVCLSVIALAFVSACGEDLRPGFCEDQTDCAPGQRCELAANAPSFHMCVAKDPSDPDLDGGARDGSDGNTDRATDTPSDRPPESGDVTSEGPPTKTCSLATAAADCKDPARPFCQDGFCVGCQAPDAGTCAPPRGTCDVTSGTCVECVTNTQCTKAEQPLCGNNLCVGCGTAGGDMGCKARDPARPVCIAATGRCAACATNAQCTAPGKGFCVAEACVGCQQAGAMACTGATPACNTTSGLCVACVADGDCKQASAPFCSNNTCVSCGMVAAGRCATLKPATPACGASGACVECVTSADCTADPNRPICNTADSTCRACTGDAECVAKTGADPGVCLDHAGGRCATEGETIFVANIAACGTAMGTKAMPLCTAEDARTLIGPARSVVVIRGTVEGFSWSLAGAPAVTIVGQQQAVIAGGVEAGIGLSGMGEALVRGITVSGSAGGGVVAASGATLRLRDAIIDRNPGGGLLIDGARFDLRNVMISNNGPGTAGSTLWGGALVLNVPGTPARLERVSFKSNRLIGITCGSGTTITSVGVYAKDNGGVGGVDVSPNCAGVATCDPESATCGSGLAAP